jgi:gliding motility-associated lipoprotein GldD
LKSGNRVKHTYIPTISIIRLCNFLVVTLIITGCNENYTPRPKGYFRIELPPKTYAPASLGSCPYSFELPSYATVVNYSDSVSEPCWKYIRFPVFNGEIFLSYKKINNNVSAYIEDARTLAYKHSVKADAIDETFIETPGKVYGIIYDIGGNAASSVQFYATDSINHFLRGALYFNVPPQPDSLAPVIQYLRQDIIRMISTTEWK